ncbi:MAG TPA: hypothetical protein VEO00_13380, partial [Actinomycetota bacterium]|nr:hypothetical protein [Actinomycetota bacterium]
MDAVTRALGDEERPAVDPVAVAWDGEGGSVRIAGRAERASIEIALEDGGRVAVRVPVERGAAALPGGLPFGYHRTRVTAGRASGEVLIIAAPRRSYAGGRRLWGVFLPLYAARSGRDWGA